MQYGCRKLLIIAVKGVNGMLAYKAERVASLFRARTAQFEVSGASFFHFEYPQERGMIPTLF
jgi:hypothetical protein